DLEEQVLVVLEAVVHAAEQVVIGEAADGLMAAAAQAEVDDHAIVNARLPVGVDRVGQAHLRLDEVQLGIFQGMAAGGNVRRQEQVIAVEEEEEFALGRAGAGVAGTTGAAGLGPAQELPGGLALDKGGSDLGGGIG